ncbi:CHAT domain-containing protein [Nonomuraea sp. SYSU D8015]|uniref:CHAT domain-containing protein n=1 Tax=Nonomuraea sp. SYSU D8015 TaxID=2593644 RepID=UPI0016608143|nr:CHAT domain-containing protein [Nonomuraea sp. SYSU D8015]
MTDPAEALAARIERFEQAADPELIWDPAALVEAERAMRACAGDRSDAATWRLIGMLHLARYRLDQRTTQDAAVAGAFFAAVAVVDPGRLPEKLRGSNVPPGDSAGTWAGLVEQVFRHVDPAAYRHVGLLIHALVRRAVARPTVEAADRLGQLLLQQAMRSTDPSWAPGALALLGGGLVRLYGQTGEKELIDDAVHVLFRAALGAPGDAARLGELAAALALAAPGDEDLIGAYLAAAESAPGTRERSQALLALLDLIRARAAGSCLDHDLLAFIRVGQCALDFWHEQWAHPGVLGPYAAGLVEWYVVTGDERSLEAGREMLAALGVTPDETAPDVRAGRPNKPDATPGRSGAVTRGTSGLSGEKARRLGADPVVRLGLLADRRWCRYGVTGEPADLEVAIEARREAAELAPPTHPDRPGLLTDLATALLERAVVTGGDPAEPIIAARTALAACSGRDPSRAEALLLLARALTLHLTPRTADEAVDALRDALAADDQLSLRAESYGLLSEVLRWRATHLSPTPQRGGEWRADDLNDAVLAARQAVELAMKTSGDQAPAQRLLALALLDRFSALGDTRDLTEALALARDGDTEVLSRLSTLLDAPVPPPTDEHLAQAATELALRSSDEHLTLKLLDLAERQVRPAGDAGGRGAFLLATALRLGELGRLRTANTILARAPAAFDAEGRRSEAAHALSKLALNHEELGEPDQALEAFERAAAAYRSLGETRSEAEQLACMGGVLLRAGDPAGAVEQYLRAVALSARAGLSREEAVHQMQAAEAYLETGNPPAALACASRARDLYLTLGETQAAAGVLIPAARAAVDQGDLTTAVERITACAIELEAAGAWEDACRALDAHAVLLAARGHRPQAAACEVRVVEIVRRRGQRREPADEWYRIARRRRAAGDAEGARSAFEQAEREYDSIGHHDGSGAVRYNLGVLAYAEGDAERALEAFGAAGETYARLRAPAKEATALTMRAACLAALERTDDALPDLERALELAAAEGDLEALFTAALHRAVLDMRRGELQEAEERLHAALDLAGADPLKEGVVRDRLAALAARTGDLRAQVESLTLAVTGFRDAAQDRLVAIASLKLGLALEEHGEHRRARSALEAGLTALAEDDSDVSRHGAAGSEPRAAGAHRTEAPFEVVAAMAASGGLDADVLARVAAIQLAVGDLTHGRATLAEAVTASRAVGDRSEATQRLERRLRIEEAEASGDLRLARAEAEAALAHADLSSAERPPADERSIERLPAGEPFAEESSAADRSHLLAKLSAFCLALGDPVAAYSHAARGYELRDDRAPEHLRNLGAAARALGRSDEAIGHLTRAVELARDTGSALPSQLVRALNALALALTDQARWPEAARAYDEGLALAAAPAWRALRAPLLSGRAGLHLKLGELDEAATAYREAISIAEELGGGRAGIGDDYADLGLVHLLRDERPQAVPLLERALEIHRANGDDRNVILDLILLARLREHDQEAAGPQEPVPTAYPGKAPQAAACLEEALAVARRAGFGAGEAMALAHLGTLDVARAEHARAHHRLSGAIDLLEALGHDPALATACHHRAAAAELIGDLPGALADAERAGRLGHSPALDRAMRLAVRLSRGTAAWTHVEQAKSRALIAQLGPDRWPVPAGLPAEVLEREQRGLEDTRALLSAAGRTRDPVQAAALVRRAHAAQADVEELWHRMEPFASDYVALRRGTPPGQPDLDALVAGGKATALLGFHVGDDCVTVLAHRTGWPQPRAFPTAVGRDLLADFARTVDGERPGLLDLAARRHRLGVWRRLADLLLCDALDALGDDDLDLLHLLPHRELHRVPVHALAPGGGPLLLERCPVAYAPSAAVLARLTRRAPSPGAGPPLRPLVLGFGRETDLRSAEEIAAILGPDPLTGRAATAAVLPGTWDIVHLSAHAVHDRRDPFASGVRLADGVLTARRLMSMDVRAGLVVLTGCDRACDGPWAGDDVAALGHAFLHAGARSALLTLWPVSAEITRALMHDVHTRLRAGTGRAQALREAVLALRELYGSAEPDLWAPYVLTGLPE